MNQHNTNSASSDDIKIVQTNEGMADGQNKCPKCGGTCIALHVGAAALRCNMCRYEFEPEKAPGLDTDISKLKGTVVGSGAMNISADAENIITLRCSSCGAEVMIDTSESAQKRCHWCRNTLSINQQIPNGSIPDMVLPFAVKKEKAREEIEKFVKKRQFFAHPTFKEEFCTENVLGAYLPYMIVSMNTHAQLNGQGEVLVRRYTETRGTGKNRQTVTLYDADLFNVQRNFDLTIEGLPIVSSSKKLDSSSDRTNNIINAIKPFDIENSVRWDPNYLKGFASEKRDSNIDDLKGAVETKAKDIARNRAIDTIKGYDRGVRWDREHLDIKGQQWKSAYFPIWLYSYLQKKNNGKDKLHYVAVNARNEKAMGSVPINQLKLILMSLLVTVMGLVAALLTSVFVLFNSDLEVLSWAFLGAGVLFYWYIYKKYRNKKARFSHETETKATISNVEANDSFLRRLTRLRNAKMQNTNSDVIRYKM